MNRVRVFRRATAAALCGVFFSVARAHEPGLSVAELRADGDAVEVKVTYAAADVRRWLPPYSLPAGVEKSPEATRAALELLRPLAAEIWEMRADDRVLAAESSAVEFPAEDNVAFRLRYRLPPGARAVTVHARKLPTLSAAHRELLRVLDAGRVRFQTTLTGAKPAASVALGETLADVRDGSAAALPSAGAFFVLGVEHIWTGYDHLLFLFALLVAARGFRSVVVIVSCFTLAHSLTLGAATLGWVWLPPAFVEPAIAVSIVFVGVENLRLRGAEPQRRGWLTFGFGLIHGFGFASVLHDMGVGSSGRALAAPLLMFNLGVEAGQICLAAVALPLMAWAFRSERIRLQGGAAASGVVALAGLYWLAERTLFG